MARRRNDTATQNLFRSNNGGEEVAPLEEKNLSKDVTFYGLLLGQNFCQLADLEVFVPPTIANGTEVIATFEAFVLNFEKNSNVMLASVGTR